MQKFSLADITSQGRLTAFIVSSVEGNSNSSLSFCHSAYILNGNWDTSCQKRSHLFRLRPSLEILQESTNSYFRRNPPKVQWRKLDRHGRHVAGMAVLKRNRIYLHLEMTRDSTGCMIALDFYIPKTQLRLREGEEYFQTLARDRTFQNKERAWIQNACRVPKK